MLKLMKYEFRKNRALLLVILGIIAALEIYFLFCAKAAARQTLINTPANYDYGPERSLLVSISLLTAASFGTALAVFIMGVSGYSRELNQKTSYLLFMTPKSALAIVGAKLLFTLIAGVAFAALLMGLASVDFPIMLDSIGREWRGYYNMLDVFMAQNDLSLTGALLTIAFFVCVVFLSVISTVGIAYLAITLSATFMRGKKGHALISVLLFALLVWANSRLTNMFIDTSSIDLENIHDLIRLVTPQIAQDVCVLALSIFACAWMLKRRVDL